VVDGQEETPPQAVVVVGASAGGVEALTRLVADLDEGLGAPVLVVLHTSPGESFLPGILERAGKLPARHAQDGDVLVHDRIYVAPPDGHLLLSDGRVRVVRGPHENGHRPAIDPLFRSAAVCYRNRTVAVVLSGSLDDGAAGCAAVSRHGGTVIVQDPADAPYPSMPLHAIAADHAEYVVELARMGVAIKEALERVNALPFEEPMEDQDAREVEVSEFEFDTAIGTRLGAESPFSCPTCGGVLRETPDDILRFRCRVGHAFGADSLLHAQSDTIDDALWMALRSLQERAELSTRLRKRMEQRGQDKLAARYEQRRLEAEQAAVKIRAALLGRDAESA
jgi:two-component system, chemotaxis family, protein-glutamate methylesterase/glutaminase